ncbi:sulfotransferase domain-containing protein [Altererythrobacter lutimaris]|uniref:Sulfotransferase domain-containing protein n=1 Tax=Altererythrobacter lutimaris TaxID=2743979 RepID=A0A850H8R0_9SPHN|nr:sulfotransferase domain-containing protein [Altererythrobacter lutimaris]NVE95537.1 sulfotransferase domain-containing protein [Altererythrobacter lutimaris]
MAGRARTIEEFIANMGAGAQLPAPDYKPYEPQDGDVFITCWAKSGTTFMQQMFHQLRTGGDMDFDDISRVVPWDDTGALCNFDMTAPQNADPRGFKSHRDYERLPAGMRYVVTLRDPKETFVSFYRFMDGWHIEPGAIAMEEFLPVWMSGGPGGCDYFTHLLSWYARRKEPDTLLSTYRWAVKNKRAMIERMAKFIGVELTQELADLVDERTTRAFMVEHMDKFDDAMVAQALEEKVGIPAASDSTKVQAEGSDAKTVPAAIAAEIDAMWTERVFPATGHADFASLAAEVDA